MNIVLVPDDLYAEILKLFRCELKAVDRCGWNAKHKGLKTVTVVKERTA